MHRTAWTKKTSSLPSDRLPPVYKQQAASNSTPKGKGKQREVPKSKELRRLEELRDGLRNSRGVEQDPTGGCFCQARTHALSPYTPICRQCGLILCFLHPAHFACPHCTAPLLTEPARESLVASLESQISDTLEKEERGRQQAIEDARKAAGAFPSLNATTNPAQPDALDSHPVNQTHKVLSLNPKTKKIKVESHRAAPAATVLPVSSSQAENLTAEKASTRVPHPPPDVIVASNASNPVRPWARLDNYDVLYVPQPNSDGRGKAKAKAGKSKKKQEGESHGSSKGAENKPV